MSWGDALVSIGSNVIGGLLNDSSDAGDTSTTVNNEPWKGIQPYLTGNTGPDGRFNTPKQNYNHMVWSELMGHGSKPIVAPPQFMHDPRLNGANTAIPTDNNGNPNFQLGGVKYNPNFIYGPTGYGFGGTGIDLREYMAQVLGMDLPDLSERTLNSNSNATSTSSASNDAYNSYLDSFGGEGAHGGPDGFGEGIGGQFGFADGTAMSASDIGIASGIVGSVMGPAFGALAHMGMNHMNDNPLSQGLLENPMIAGIKGLLGMDSVGMTAADTGGADGLSGDGGHGAGLGGDMADGGSSSDNDGANAGGYGGHGGGQSEGSGGGTGGDNGGPGSDGGHGAGSGGDMGDGGSSSDNDGANGGGFW